MSKRRHRVRGVRGQVVTRPVVARDEMAPIFRQDVKGGGGKGRGIALDGEDAFRGGGGVKSWGTPTGKSPDYFTDCRRRPR